MVLDREMIARHVSAALNDGIRPILAAMVLIALVTKDVFLQLLLLLALTLLLEYELEDG